MADPTAKERLLVVDDALDTREVLQRNLSLQGFQVFAAGNVAEAVRLLESIAVDLVITDLKMPGATGLDLVRHVRENFKDTDVIDDHGLSHDRRCGDRSQDRRRGLPHQAVYPGRAPFDRAAGPGQAASQAPGARTT